MRSQGQRDLAQFCIDRGIDVDSTSTDRWTLDQADEAHRKYDRQSGGKAVFLT